MHGLEVRDLGNAKQFAEELSICKDCADYVTCFTIDTGGYPGFGLEILQMGRAHLFCWNRQAACLPVLQFVLLLSELAGHCSRDALLAHLESNSHVLWLS